MGKSCKLKRILLLLGNARGMCLGRAASQTGQCESSRRTKGVENSVSDDVCILVPSTAQLMAEMITVAAMADKKAFMAATSLDFR